MAAGGARMDKSVSLPSLTGERRRGPAISAEGQPVGLLGRNPAEWLSEDPGYVRRKLGEFRRGRTELKRVLNNSDSDRLYEDRIHFSAYSTQIRAQRARKVEMIQNQDDAKRERAGRQDLRSTPSLPGLAVRPVGVAGSLAPPLQGPDGPRGRDAAGEGGSIAPSKTAAGLEDLIRQARTVKLAVSQVQRARDPDQEPGRREAVPASRNLPKRSTLRADQWRLSAAAVKQMVGGLQQSHEDLDDILHEKKPAIRKQTVNVQDVGGQLQGLFNFGKKGAAAGEDT